MEYTTLGRTGLNVSRVGLGGGGIGQVWGVTTRDEAVRAVHRALDLGVNFFDVAPAYGNGKAEEALGLALRDRSEVLTHHAIGIRPVDGRYCYNVALIALNVFEILNEKRG